MLSSIDIIVIILTILAVVLVTIVSIKNYRDAKIRQKHVDEFLERRQQRRRNRQ